MNSIGASSRSPSPITIVPSMGTESSSRRIAVTAACVCLRAVALPHRLGAGDGRLLDDAEELEREVGVHLLGGGLAP